ncbi:MAG: bacteriochlorophyll/chlorophyll a synthase, partial [Pseudomonadota bacterium]
LGPKRAALLACWTMGLAQIAVIGLLLAWGHIIHAAVVAALIVAQLMAMRVLLRDPKGRAPWYNGTGVGPYVLGMMVSALALGGWL